MISIKYSTGMVEKSLRDIFRKRLKASRKAAGLTQAQVAEALGIDIETVSRWERGARFPDDLHIEKLAGLLCIPPYSLFQEGAGEKSNLVAMKVALMVSQTTEILDLLSERSDLEDLAQKQAQEIAGLKFRLEVAQAKIQELETGERQKAKSNRPYVKKPSR